MSEKNRATTVGIVVKPQPQTAVPVLSSLVSWLDENKLDYRIDPIGTQLLQRSGNGAVERSEMPELCDVIVVLGGDGTLLSAARHLHRREIPIIGVNLGRLGFLTEIPTAEMIATLDAYLEGRADIQYRMMLLVRLIRGGECLATFNCLNDAVLNKAALARIIHFSVEVGGQWLTDMRADGLIVATPTGSTAYNLAAGGPILTPGMGAVIISPLCPHTLSMRPLIMEGRDTIRVTLLQDSGEVYLTADGQMGHPLQINDQVLISKSPHRTPLVVRENRDYFALLRQKLGWGAR
ncbi:MAG: NAD(+)/NADH kinase [Acidobacteriota bacterium]|jgi:NAD+ kinase